MRCCVIPRGQIDAGSSQKHFLPSCVLLNVGMDPNFPQKKFVFLFGFIQREISLSGENIFSLGCIHYVCYRGGQRIFFSAARFFISPPPQGPYKFSEPTKQSAEKLIPPPPPSPLPRNIKINICIIVNYICLKSQETCLIRTSREL